MTGARATQIRATFLQPGGNLRVVWWVSNAALPLDQLAEDAERDLRDLLVDEHIELVEAPLAWHRAEGERHSTWLVLDAVVRPWLDPRRDQARRATTPR